MKLFLLLLLAQSIHAAVESGSPLSFDKALQEILERDTNIQSQKALLEEIESKNLPSHYYFLPSVSATASQSYLKDLGTPRVGSRSATLKADLNLFKFGGDMAGARAATAEERAQQFSLENTYLLTEEKAVSALLGAIQSEMTVRTYLKISEMRQDAVKIAQARYKKGLVASQEAEKFLVDSDNAQAQLKDAEGNLVLAKAELINLLGHDRIDYEWPWKQEFLKKETSLANISGSLETRPDYLSAISLEEQANALSKQAWSGMFPSLDISLSYGYLQAFEPAPSTSGPQWLGMATLTIPLFNKLSNVGSYRASIAKRTQSQMKLESIKRKAQSEFQSAKTALEISVDSAKMREITLSTSRKLYESNLQRFRRAIVNANELMNDQDRLFQSELLAIKGWADAHLRLTQLCHSYGKKLAECLAVEPVKSRRRR